MKTSEFKKALEKNEVVRFFLPDNTEVPQHFHITEMGILNKKYTDCGNTFREENYFTFQIWYSTDIDHRLTSTKLLKIIEGIEKKSQETDFEIQVEYQNNMTIGKFSLTFNGLGFHLTNTDTTCLAKNNCGITSEKKEVKISEWKPKSNSCSTETNCC